MKGIAKKFLLLMLVLAMLFTTACGNGDPVSDNDPENSGETDVSGETNVDDTIVFGAQAEPAHMNPFRANSTSDFNAILCVMETLVTQANDDPNEIVPALATDWVYNEDNTELTFTLREGVKFHNGDPMTAEDVAYCINRTISSGNCPTYTSNMDHMEVVDENHVTLYLKFAYVPTLQCLTIPCFSITSEAYIEDCEANGIDFERKPIGTACYKFDDWVSGEKIVFSAFDEYWGGEAPVQNYIYRIMTDDTTRMMALENGEIDIVYNPTRTDKEYIESIEGLAFECSETAGSWVYVMFNCIDPESNFSDVRTRQAVASAIRRDDFVAGAINGLGVTIECPMPPAVDGYDYDFKFWEYDQDKARDLLAEAGFADGLTETLKTSQQAMVKTTSEILQSQLSEVGIDLEIEILERSTFNTEVLDNMDYKVTIWNTTASIMDADFALYNAYSSFNVGQGQASNNHGATDPHIDDVLTQARFSSDPEERSALYEEVFEWVKETCCRIPLYAPSYNLAYNDSLEGVIPNAVNRYVASFYSWAE